MDCKIIFYSARKTSFCERALLKSFSELDLLSVNTSFAADKQSLGKLLIEAYDECDIAFVIGGLGLDGEREIGDVISKALNSSDVDEFKKLKNPDGNDGYVVNSHGQLLIILPDEPQEIEKIMQGSIGNYIKQKDNDNVRV